MGCITHVAVRPIYCKIHDQKIMCWYTNWKVCWHHNTTVRRWYKIAYITKSESAWHYYYYYRNVCMLRYLLQNSTNMYSTHKQKMQQCPNMRSYTNAISFLMFCEIPHCPTLWCSSALTIDYWPHVTGLETDHVFTFMAVLYITVVPTLFRADSVLCILERTWTYPTEVKNTHC